MCKSINCNYDIFRTVICTHLKGQLKWCHNLLILLHLFQTCMRYFFWWIVKYIFWLRLVTKQLMVTIDFHSMKKLLCKSVASVNCLVANILVSIRSETSYKNIYNNLINIFWPFIFYLLVYNSAQMHLWIVLYSYTSIRIITCHLKRNLLKESQPEPSPNRDTRVTPILLLVLDLNLIVPIVKLICWIIHSLSAYWEYNKIKESRLALSSLNLSVSCYKWMPWMHF